MLHPAGGADSDRLPGELLSIATSDAQRVGTVNLAVAMGTGVLAALAIAAIVLLQISLPLGLLVVLGLPPVLLFVQLAGRPLSRRAAAEQGQAAAAAGLATDLVRGLRVLKGIGAEAAAIDRYRRASRESLGATLRAARAEAAYDASTIVLTGAFLVLVALVAARLAVSGDITIGELIAAIGLTQFLIGPLGRVSYVGGELARARASAERVAAVLALPPAVSGGTRAPASPARGELRLTGVTHDALRGLTAELPAGAFVGVVAADPESAHALLQCLARDADPASGEIQLDGMALTELDPVQLHRAVLVAPHDADLFEQTLAENVAAAARRARGPRPRARCRGRRRGGRGAARRAADTACRARQLAVGRAAPARRACPRAGGRSDRARAARADHRRRRRHGGEDRDRPARDPPRPQHARPDEQPGAARGVRSRDRHRGRDRRRQRRARRAAAAQRGVPRGGARMTPAELLPTAGAAETRRTVWELMRPHRPLAALTVVVLLAGTVAGLAVPPVLGHIVDLVVDDKPASALTTPVVVLLALTLAQGILTGLGTALVAGVGEPVLAVLRERVVRARAVAAAGADRARGQRRPARPRRRRRGRDGAGGAQRAARVRDLRADRRIDRRRSRRAGLAARTRRPVRDADPGLDAALVPRAGGAAVCRRARRRSGRAQQLLDSIGGATTVRAFGLAKPQTARIADRSQAALDLSLRAVHLQTRFYGRLNVAELAGTGAILLAGFLLVRDGAVTVGEATAAALYFVRLFDPLNMLLGLIDDIQSAGASLARLVGVAQLLCRTSPRCRPSRATPPCG